MTEREAWSLVKIGNNLTNMEFKVFDFLMSISSFKGGYSELTKAIDEKIANSPNVRKAVISLENKKLISVLRKYDSKVAAPNPMVACCVYDLWWEYAIKEERGERNV